MRRSLMLSLALCAWAPAPLAAQALSHLNVPPEQIVHLDFIRLFPDDSNREGQYSGVILSTPDGTQKLMKAVPPGMALVITDLHVMFFVDPSEYPNGFMGAVTFGAQEIDYREFRRSIDFTVTAPAGHGQASGHYAFTAGMAFSGKAIPVFTLSPMPKSPDTRNPPVARASGYLVPIGRSPRFPFPLPF